MTASSTGAQPAPADRIGLLLAKQDIYEVLARFLRAVDRGDVDGAAACYLPGATEDHGGVFTGSAADYLQSVATTLTHPRALTTHAMTNVLIEFEDGRSDIAWSESYVLAFARVRRPDGVVGDTLTSVRIMDEFGFEDGRWGIRHRALRWDWNHDMEKSETWLFGLLVPSPDRLEKGGKFPDDVVYRHAASSGVSE